MGSQRGCEVSIASPHGCPAGDNGPFIPALRDRDTLAACSGGGKVPSLGPSPTRGHGLSPTVTVWCSVGLSQRDSVKYPKKLLYSLHLTYTPGIPTPPVHHIPPAPLSHSLEPSHPPALISWTLGSISGGGGGGIPSQNLWQRIRVPWPYPIQGVSDNKVLSETPGARTSALKG